MHNEHSSPDSIFEPLDAGIREIRLLIIRPSLDIDDPVVCRLIKGSLDDDSQYYALSYTWGTSDNPSLITINDTPWVVGPNLHDALKYLRLEDKAITLWVDAICINQKDDSEKSYQVAMMADIYRKARGVRAWIGLPETDEEVDKADGSACDWDV
ncbi:Heterokaryon incompatibility protein 6 OR allele [Lachnellula suecica]|uniref:Heterokaryon incompatibility protein 6 OR allele n=1 Tax=Lachnellula suecica TaxID=602035 RepID=A0A8T9CFR0_9HELO|nr:Heterokaryon incompatibility protein 6 OR allele [Lachnellula suecica]